uniref:Uncharacterized protein n=1 Tax=Octopus bimaculoides TaxID=37653 RepID=A0A0L8HMY1_OCTBM
MGARCGSVSSSNLSPSEEELVKSLKRIDEVMEVKNFAEAVKDKSEGVFLEELNRFKGILKKEGSDVKISPPSETTDKVKRTTLYRTYSLKLLRIQVATKSQVERALRPIWKEVNYFT